MAKIKKEDFAVFGEKSPLVSLSGELSNFLQEDFDNILQYMNSEKQSKKLKL